MACALLIGAIAVVAAHAQSGVRIGPVVDYEFGVPLTLARGTGTVNGRDVPADGRSYNNTIGAGISASLPALLGDRFGLSGRVSLLAGSGLYRSNFQSDREFDPISGSIVPASYQLRFTSSTVAVNLELGLQYSADAIWSGGIGLWVGIPTRTTFATDLRKLAPLPAGLGAGDSVLPSLLASTATPGARGGFVLGGSLAVPFNNFLRLAPELFVRGDAGALFDGLGIRAFSVGAGVGFQFGDYSAPPDTAPPPQPVPPPDTARRVEVPRDSVPPAAPALAASIDIYSIGAAGAQLEHATIATHLVRQRRQTPFPAAIFFDDDSAMPASKYVRFTRDDASRFSLASLARGSHYQVYCDALNLLGLRLSENPAADVTLRAAAADNESEATARRRADGVRDYLVQAWGIEASRINVKTEKRSAHGMFDRCVRLESNTPAVTAPVMVEWRARTFQLPPLDIQPAIKAQAGVRIWEVTVRQGSDVVTHYSNRPGDRGSSDIALHIPDDMAEFTLPPLVAELAVTDSTGATASARDSLPLVIGPDASGTGAAARELGERSDYLLLPEGGVPEYLRSGSSALRDIAATVRPGDRVTVTDGPAGHGPEVADALRRLVRATGVRVELSHDETADRAAADGPEAALLAAGVTVLVEHGLSDSNGRQ